MSEENKTVVKRFVEEFQTSNDPAAFDELVADDFVNHAAMEGLPPGKAGVKVLFDVFRSAFDGFRAEIHDQAAEDDKVWTRKSFYGTHTGDFMGIPATGKPIRIDVIDTVRVRHGRIVEHWGIVDQLGLMKQLGAL
jgi:steroid delta-isomerase-like uncharacterized protein